MAAADVPVRMALGETHVIAMTKRALGEAGVDVEALEGAAAASGKAAAQKHVERSGTALLVKNLPYTASEAELQVSIFGGILTREHHSKSFPAEEKQACLGHYKNLLRFWSRECHMLYLTNKVDPHVCHASLDRVNLQL